MSSTALKAIIVKYSTILFLAYVLEMWFFEFDNISFPRTIPYLRWSTTGAILFAISLSCTILLNRELLRKDSSLTISRLVMYSCLAGLCSEVFLQIARQFMFTDVSIPERIYLYLRGLIGAPIACGIFSFFVAVQLKTKKLWNVVGIMFLVFFLCSIILTLLKK